jgi:hypothetical protein
MTTIKYDRARIWRLTVEGLEYVANDGSLCFIDFAICRENMKSELGGDSLHYVGFRDFSAKPPYVTFQTDPPMTFEFPTFPTWPDASGVFLTYDPADLREFRAFRNELRQVNVDTVDLA